MLEITIISCYITKKSLNWLNKLYFWVFTKAHPEHKIYILLVGY